MKKDEILLLANNLTVAARLTDELRGVSAARVEAIQEKLVKTVIADFLKKAEEETAEKEKYRAPAPPPTLIQPVLLTEEDPGTREVDEDAIFMADLAAQIKKNGPYSRTNPLKSILTEDKIKRAYSIAHTDVAVAERLGIGKSTAARMRMAYK